MGTTACQVQSQESRPALRPLFSNCPNQHQQDPIHHLTTNTAASPDTPVFLSPAHCSPTLPPSHSSDNIPSCEANGFCCPSRTRSPLRPIAGVAVGAPVPSVISAPTFPLQDSQPGHQASRLSAAQPQPTNPPPQAFSLRLPQTPVRHQACWRSGLTRQT